MRVCKSESQGVWETFFPKPLFLPIMPCVCVWGPLHMIFTQQHWESMENNKVKLGIQEYAGPILS